MYFHLLFEDYINTRVSFFVSNFTSIFHELSTRSLFIYLKYVAGSGGGRECRSTSSTDSLLKHLWQLGLRQSAASLPHERSRAKFLNHYPLPLQVCISRKLKSGARTQTWALCYGMRASLSVPSIHLPWTFWSILWALKEYFVLLAEGTADKLKIEN